jgi:hypothetical protein
VISRLEGELIRHMCSVYCESTSQAASRAPGNAPNHTHGKTCENPEECGDAGVAVPLQSRCHQCVDDHGHEWAEVSMLSVVYVQGHEATRLRLSAGLLSRLTLRAKRKSHNSHFTSDPWTSSITKRPTSCFPPTALHFKGDLSLVNALREYAATSTCLLASGSCPWG